MLKHVQIFMYSNIINIIHALFLNLANFYNIDVKTLISIIHRKFSYTLYFINLYSKTHLSSIQYLY